METLDMLAQLWIRALETSGQFSLPGIGHFRAETSPAKISFGEKTITPPNLVVDFEADAEARGEKLVDLISSEFQVSAELGWEFLDRQMVALKKELSESGQFAFPGFGMIQKTSGGIIRFIPEDGIAFLPEAYGLPKITAETLQSSVRQQVEKEIPVIPLRPFDEPVFQKTKKQKSMGLRWVAAASIVLALGISAGSVWYMAQPAELASTKVKPVSQEASMVNISLSDEKKVADEPIAVDKPNPVVAEKKSTAVATATHRIQYFVIAGSFKLVEKSAKLQKALVFRGYGAQLLPNEEKGTTRVSVAQFQSKEAALQFIKQAQELFDEQLWILEQ